MREIPLDSPEFDEVVGEYQKSQLLDEIELLDGASAEFDQELVSKRRAFTGILWICPDQLWRGNFPEAFPSDDHISPCKKSRLRYCGSHEGRILCVCI